MKNKILCIGHSTLDTFIKVRDADIHCGLNKESCQVCFDFGAKIPVDEIHYGIGGGAANVSVGLSKLGILPYIYTIVGEDPKGVDVKNDFVKHKVNTKYLFSDHDTTDQATVISYDEDRTIFTYNHSRKYSLTKVEENFEYLFVSSVGKDVSGLYDEVIDLRKKRGITLFYNPGSKELVNSHDDIQKLLPHIDYLIANVDEGCVVMNKTLKREQTEVTDLTTMLMDKGVKNIVLTDGEKGAYFQNAKDSFHTPALGVDVVERTGAGDAFASGFIAGIMNKISSKEASLWGSINSAEVIKSFGAQSGLLSKGEILNKLKEMA